MATLLDKGKRFPFEVDADEKAQERLLKNAQKFGVAVLKPKTNADRIRAMTDEELADKFEEIQLKQTLIQFSRNCGGSVNRTFNCDALAADVGLRRCYNRHL